MLKRLKYILILAIILLPIKANALAGTTSIGGNIEIDKGATITVDITISGGADIRGYIASLEYDNTKLELDKAKSIGQNGFNLTVGKNVLLDALEPKGGNFTIAKLVFKAKDSFIEGTSTTIKLSGISIFDGASENTLANVSKTITVKKVLSANNYLSGITINGNKLSNFNKDTLTYTQEVESNVTTVSIEATKEDSSATITGTGIKNLNDGENKYTITVKSENGSERNYTVIINKKAPASTNNYLSGITINGNKLNNFNKDTTTYNYTVENNVSSVNLDATTEHAKATISGTGKKQLSVGENKYTITVKSESGAVRKYTIVINRKKAASNNNGSTNNNNSNNNNNANNNTSNNNSNNNETPNTNNTNNDEQKPEKEPEQDDTENPEGDKPSQDITNNNPPNNNSSSNNNTSNNYDSEEDKKENIKSDLTIYIVIAVLFIIDAILYTIIAKKKKSREQENF